MSKTAERVCVGKIVAPHGVGGDVRVLTFTTRPEDVAAYGPVGDESGGRSFEISVLGVKGNMVTARIAGVGNRDDAEALRGMTLHVGRDKLPAPEPEEYYHADLLGLVAERRDGTRLGRVRSVDDHGAGDVIEIEGDDGAITVVPFTRRAVPEVDLTGGRLIVDPPAELTMPASKARVRTR